MEGTTAGLVRSQRLNPGAVLAVDPARHLSPSPALWMAFDPDASSYGSTVAASFAAGSAGNKGLACPAPQSVVHASALQAMAAALPAGAPYEGEEVHECPAGLDFAKAQAVIVSGAFWNPCGHVLLCVENADGHKFYFHVTDLYGPPKAMTEDGYKRYLADSHKHEIGRQDGHLRDPAAAYRKLMQLVSEPWLWTGIPHNCVTFVQEVIAAGGGRYSAPWNCAANGVKALNH